MQPGSHTQGGALLQTGIGEVRQVGGLTQYWPHIGSFGGRGAHEVHDGNVPPRAAELGGGQTLGWPLAFCTGVGQVWRPPSPGPGGPCVVGAAGAHLDFGGLGL